MSNARAGADAPHAGPKKTAVRTARSPLSGGEIPLGAHPGNTGGKKGRSGRKPLAFKAECERLRDSEVLAKVAAYLAKADPGDDAWVWCAEYVTKYTASLAPTRAEVTGADGAPLIPPGRLEPAEIAPRLRAILAGRN